MRRVTSDGGRRPPRGPPAVERPAHTRKSRHTRLAHWLAAAPHRRLHSVRQVYAFHVGQLSVWTGYFPPRKAMPLLTVNPIRPLPHTVRFLS